VSIDYIYSDMSMYCFKDIQKYEKILTRPQTEDRIFNMDRYRNINADLTLSAMPMNIISVHFQLWWLLKYRSLIIITIGKLPYY
jgi:hypothetical protein